ncbi:MAG: DNA polymerase III subunit delta' [Bdellovibrionota bacterium]
MNLKPLAQDAAWNTLARLAGAIPQGLILIGPAGVGKRRAVRALYQLIHCTKRSGDEPCGECVSCLKIAQNKHADFIEIAPQGETIIVDDLRDIKKSLFFAPMEGKWRFIVIDQAHKLNVSSANTLLKTLEEPPSHTRFFLITHERALLLPTIISRCQFVHFSPLDNETLTRLVTEMGLSVPNHLLSISMDLLNGGLEKASFLAQEATIAFLDEVLRELHSKPTRWEDVIRFADTLGSEEWKLPLFLDILIRHGHEWAVGSENREEAWRVANNSLKAAYLKRRLERHANKKLVALAASELSTRFHLGPE